MAVGKRVRADEFLRTGPEWEAFCMPQCLRGFVAEADRPSNNCSKHVQGRGFSGDEHHERQI